ncbi:MAG TPA: P1 family peptidase [Thermomicrobiales bacterium]|jgi:L-aminopeptidase/D-esterase-like protein|nr:P1 family peptidase [Thermomicrobiales bacterium]
MTETRDDGQLGVWIGHWTDTSARTGCTVVLFPESLPTVVDQRGGAPGTRETDVLRDGNLVRRADAILLTGGSAFGLAAADGVAMVLREQGRGFPTAAGPVPIVPGAVVFDLANGEAAWPGPDEGRAALAAAVPLDDTSRGRVGAGTGATTGKVAGKPMLGGFGVATIRSAAGAVTAMMVVNSFGVVDGPDPRPAALGIDGASLVGTPGENTTIGALLIDAAVDATTLHRCAIAAHDALARVIVPAHTIFDGDTIFVSGTRLATPGPAEIFGIAMATELAVEAAIRDAVICRAPS